MTTTVRSLLDSFDALSESDRHEAAAEIFRRTDVASELPDEAFATTPESGKNHLTSAASRGRSRRGLLIAGVIVGLILAVLLAGYVCLRAIIDSGITSGPDNLFGDQHLKTAVSLIELHKLRYGKYPGTLGDLKYLGKWDPIALQGVTYTPNEDRTAYYVEVHRGWVGKPNSQMPDEFWQGTGYSESLNPDAE
jgi:hypothetical protein